MSKVSKKGRGAQIDKTMAEKNRDANADHEQDGKQKSARLNYCTHAIEAFEEQAEMIERLAPHLTTGFEVFMAGMLRESQKFMLPDNGMLFEGHDYRPEFFDFFRLPFPIVALEFAADESLYSEGSGLFMARKRIALGFDPHKLPATLTRQLSELLGPNNVAALPDQAICIMAIYEGRAEERDVWMSSMGILCVDLENDVPVKASDSNIDEDPMSRRVRERIEADGQNRRTKHGLPGTFLLFPRISELFSVHNGISRSKQLENLAIDIIDESRALYQFCVSLGCSNVTTTRVPASKTLNAMRARKGKTPMYDYHILEINTHREEATSEDRQMGGGHGAKASPRMHLRRGHIRRLGERFANKIVWINATVVGSKEKGMVDKKYEVR